MTSPVSTNIELVPASGGDSGGNSGGGSSEVGQMIALLQRQCDGYHQLIGLGEQQSKLIDEGDPEPLLALLSQRQALIDPLAEIGEQVAAFHQQWPSISAAIDEQTHQQVRDLVAQVELLLGKIIEQDEKDRGQLEAARQQTGQQLRQVASVPQALRAYKSAASSSPRFTDRQG